MPITFFSVNGAGSGGGGGGTVTTANGISGTGSAGSPVILGGNALNQDTTIQLATHTLDFSDSDGAGNASDYSFANGLINLDIVDASGNQSLINAQSNNLILRYISPSNNSSFLEIGADAVSNDVEVSIATSNIAGAGKSIYIKQLNGHGIAVADNFDNIGLIGRDLSDTANVLFPVSDPAQYAQYGNIPNLASPIHQNTNQTIPLVTPILVVPGGSNKLVKIDVATTFGTFFAGDSFTALIQYFDVNGNNQNVNLQTMDVGNRASSNPSIVLAVQQGSNVDLSITPAFGLGSTYNYYAVAEVLGNIP